MCVYTIYQRSQLYFFKMLLFISLMIIIILLMRNACSRKVIWFYRPDCGHCQNMMSNWESFETRCALTMLPPVSTKKVNINEPNNQELAQNYGVQGVPFIVRLDGDGYRNLYSGDRSAEDLLHWSQS